MLNKILPAGWTPSDLCVHVWLCVTESYATKLDVETEASFGLEVM